MRRYPWGADLDDDGDGEFTYRLGGNDYDDSDPALQQLSGNGGFLIGLTQDLGAGASPTGVATGDWNNDGNPDVAVSNQDNETVSIFLGQGDGSVLSSQVLSTPGSGGGRIVPFDFDGDGHLDLLATHSGLILRGEGGGTFQQSGSTPGTCPYSEVIDVDGDDRLDIICASGSADDIVVFLLGENESFTPVNTPDTEIRQLSAGFLNGDDIIDLVIVTPDWSVRALIGNGDGTFSLVGVLAEGANYNTLAIPRDVSGDGLSDVVAGDFIDDTISLIRGHGNGLLQSPAEVVVAGPSADGIFTGDLNGDGAADIVHAAQQAGFGVSMATGEGFFGGPSNYPMPGAIRLAPADFNRDGRLDFAVVSISTDTLTILLGE